MSGWSKLFRSFLAGTSLCAVAFTAEAQISAPDQIDIGQTREDEPRQFEFRIKNNSSETVKVVRLGTSCTCTKAKLDGSEILLPDDERIIHGEAKLGKLVGEAYTKLSIESQSHDGSNHINFVQIKGDVVVPLLLSTKMINLGEIDQTSAPVRFNFLAEKGNSGEEWNSIQAASTDDHVKTSVEKSSTDKYRVVAEFDPHGLPISAYHSEIKLQLLQQEKIVGQEQKILINARVRGPMTSSLHSLYFGSTSLSEQSIAVKSSTLDLRDLIVEQHPEFTVTDLRASSDGKSATVTVRLAQKSRSGLFKGMISLLHRSSNSRMIIPVLIAFSVTKE